MRRRAIIITLSTVALLASGVIAAWAIPSQGQDGEADTAISLTDVEQTLMNRLNVQTEVASGSDLTEIVTVNGDAEAQMDVTFSAEIPGRVEYLGTDVGQRVKKGLVLAKVDYKTLRAQRKQAEAAYNLAEKTEDRLKTLGDKLVSRQKMDEVGATLESARAALEIAKHSSGKSLVRSTLRGVVSAKYVEEAEYVVPGAPLFRVVDYSTIIIDAKLPESQVSHISKDTSVTVNFGALRESREGTVEAVVPTADAVSKTFTARIRVENQDLRILPGMSATIKIPGKKFENVVVVPQDLVIESASGKSVFVIEDGKAYERRVALGGVEQDRVAIVAGVTPGEVIVTTGHRDLTDGQPVTIVE